MPRRPGGRAEAGAPGQAKPVKIADKLPDLWQGEQCRYLPGPGDTVDVAMGRHRLVQAPGVLPAPAGRPVFNYRYITGPSKLAGIRVAVWLLSVPSGW